MRKRRGRERERELVVTRQIKKQGTHSVLGRGSQMGGGAVVRGMDGWEKVERESVARAPHANPVHALASGRTGPRHARTRFSQTHTLRWPAVSLRASRTLAQPVRKQSGAPRAHSLERESAGRVCCPKRHDGHGGQGQQGRLGRRTRSPAGRRALHSRRQGKRGRHALPFLCSRSRQTRSVLHTTK